MTANMPAADLVNENARAGARDYAARGKLPAL